MAGNSSVDLEYEELPMLCWYDEGRQCTSQCMAFNHKEAESLQPWRRCILLRAGYRGAEALLSLVQILKEGSGQPVDYNVSDPPPEVR